MATISRADLERARQARDIVRTIEWNLNLRLQVTGQSHRGACPFHHDDRHDLCVYPTQQRFHCVGCWAAGDALDFLHRYDLTPYGRIMARHGFEYPYYAVPEPEPVGPSMPAFVITRAGEFVDAQVCPSPVIKVGRVASSHLLLDDPKVSRMHAVIEVADRVWLIDLGSASGTYVNDQHMRSKAALQLGDVVRIGEHELRFVELVVPPSPDRDHAAALASARICLSLAERAIAHGRMDEARAQLRAARVHVRDPALELARARLELDVANWPADEEGVACWLDAAGRARLEALIDATTSSPAHDGDDERLHAAMERAVLREPTDDGPRLVYADWLQQRGDPRGEFITLSIAEQRGTLDIPGQWRLQELLETHRARWSAEFTTHGATVEFRRGFPAVVRHTGLWSRALIGLVRSCTTIHRVEGPRIPDVLADLTSK